MRSLFWGGVLICAFFAAGTKANQPDLFDEGMEALERKQHRTAITNLSRFLSASFGDERIPQAEAALAEAQRALRVSLIANGLIEDAVQLMLPDDGAASDELIRRELEALDFLKQELHRSVAESRFAVALQCLALLAHHFPEAESPLTAAELQDLRLRLLRQLGSGRIDVVVDAMIVSEADRLPLEQLRQVRADPDQLWLQYAEFNRDRGWYAQAMAALQRVGQRPGTSVHRLREADRLRLAVLDDMVDFAEAYGRPPFAAAVHDVLRSHAEGLAPRHPISQLATRFGRSLPSTIGPPLDLAFPEPIIGDGQWSDQGQGLVVAQPVIRLGQRGKGRAVVTVAPGTQISGGGITLDESTLTLRGTPEKPIHLRNVIISVGIRGHLQADYVVFEDCTFRWMGGWFHSSYTSKWTFRDCLFVRSNFAALDQRNYGLSVTDCDFLGCILPPRALRSDQSTDLASRYRDDWNRVESSDFIGCRISPSFAWMTNDCNFVFSRVDAPQCFTSATDLVVRLGIVDTWQPTLAALDQGSEYDGPGRVRFAPAPRPYLRRPEVHRGLWALVDEVELPMAPPPRGK